MIITKCNDVSRGGITLMEVLIAMGILAVGLTSVAALVPAGGSQARKAIISDRAANLAENALADAITIGLTRPLSLTGTASRVVIDPAGSLGLAAMTDGSLQTTGILSTATGGTAISPSVALLFGQNRDDVVFNPPANDDAALTNAFVDGARAFEGRSTCMWGIETLDGGPIAAEKFARLSVVVFYDRLKTDRTMQALIDSTGRIYSFNLPTGRTIKEIFRTGTVICVDSASGAPQTALFGMRSATVAKDMNGNDDVYGVFDQQPPAGSIKVLLDSVGIAQAIVKLEAPGPFSSIMPRQVSP